MCTGFAHLSNTCIYQLFGASLKLLLYTNTICCEVHHFALHDILPNVWLYSIVPPALRAHSHLPSTAHFPMLPFALGLAPSRAGLYDREIRWECILLVFRILHGSRKNVGAIAIICAMATNRLLCAAAAVSVPPLPSCAHKRNARRFLPSGFTIFHCHSFHLIDGNVSSFCQMHRKMPEDWST